MSRRLNKVYMIQQQLLRFLLCNLSDGKTGTGLGHPGGVGQWAYFFLMEYWLLYDYGMISVCSVSDYLGRLEQRNYLASILTIYLFSIAKYFSLTISKI
jgi:hypothetical protein